MKNQLVQKFPSTGGVSAEGGRGGTNALNKEKSTSTGAPSGRGGTNALNKEKSTSTGAPSGRGGTNALNKETPTSTGAPSGRGGSNALPEEIFPLVNNTPRIRRNTRNFMNLPYNPKLKARARALRKAGNLPEVVFWNRVKNKQFYGYDFDRQKIIGNSIVDFYCANFNLVVEIDGSSHNHKQEYDAARDAYLKSIGLKVIHIPVSAVMRNLECVVELVEESVGIRR